MVGPPCSKTEVVNLLESAGFSRANPYYVVQQGKVAALQSCVMRLPLDPAPQASFLQMHRLYGVVRQWLSAQAAWQLPRHRCRCACMPAAHYTMAPAPDAS